MTSSARSEASQSIPSSALMDDASVDSDTPSLMFDFFAGFDKFSSSNDFKKGLRTPKYRQLY